MNDETEPRTLTTFTSLTDFYRARGGGPSPESDYGAHNYRDQDAYRRFNRPTFRVSHVHETGDWYAYANNWPLTKDSLNLHQVILLGTIEDKTINETDVNRYFETWASTPEPGRPLSWFRQKIELFNRINLKEEEPHEQ